MSCVKPVPKFVGYAARGLGVLLVHNSKEVMNIEKVNPMAIIKIVSGDINETQFLEDINYTCSWNWQWGCKKHGGILMSCEFLTKVG